MDEKKSTAGESAPVVDPEMLENLDLLLNMEAIEEEDNWDTLENLEKPEDE